jgi:hypothetical protein
VDANYVDHGFLIQNGVIRYSAALIEGALVLKLSEFGAAIL